jgi:predicted Zn-dependent protease
MQRTLLFIITLLFIAGCSTVMITGRRQLLLVSDAELLTMSLQSYQQFIDSVPASKDVRNTSLVRNVGIKIASAVEEYLRLNDMEAEINNFAWEFNLVQDTTVNAFCMPGGKIVFFEGILPYTRTEGGIAVVMGHEIAHAVAKHSNERLSQQMLLQYGAAITDLLVYNKSEITRAGINTLYGIGAQVGVLLPYSRKQEYEADRLGMILMAMAGYDPAETLIFWERMTASGSGSVVDFMSTHPSDQKRIANIQKVLPEAQGYLKP